MLKQYKYYFLLFLGILISILIRGYFILNGAEVADVHSLKEMGEMIYRGINLYLALSYNAYPPLATLLRISHSFALQIL